ncbi:MAG: PAS domain-containing protein, partial [Candidatus Saccharimonadales bacterium]
MWSHSSASAAPFTGALSPHFASGSDDSGRGFREIIDALPVAVYTTDMNGKLTHFNPVCVEFAGRTPA